LEWLALRTLHKAYARLQKLEKAGVPSHQAWNQCAVHLVEAAKVY
jgi:hypothetical protein